MSLIYGLAGRIMTGAIATCLRRRRSGEAKRYGFV